MWDLRSSLEAEASASATAKSVLRALANAAYMRSNCRRALSDVDGFALSNATSKWCLTISLKGHYTKVSYGVVAIRKVPCNALGIGVLELLVDELQLCRVHHLRGSVRIVISITQILISYSDVPPGGRRLRSADSWGAQR